MVINLKYAKGSDNMSFKISDTKRRRILNRDEHKCQVCNKKLRLSIESDLSTSNAIAQIDHIIPRSLGGKNNDDNLRILCRTCNSSRGNRTSSGLVSFILNTIENGVSNKYSSKLNDEAKLGFISKGDIDSIEKSLIEEFNKNMRTIEKCGKIIEGKEK